MGAHETLRSSAVDLQEECRDAVLAELAARGALPATDHEIRAWGRRAYAMTKQRYLAGGGEQLARQAAQSVALEVVAYITHQVLASGRQQDDRRTGT